MHRRCTNPFLSLALIVQVRNWRTILLSSVVVLLALLTDVGASFRVEARVLLKRGSC